MIKRLESKMRPVGNRRLPIARMIWAGLLAISLCNVYSDEAMAADTPIPDQMPGACCVGSGASSSCQVAVLSHGTYSCNGAVSPIPFGGSCSVGACILPDDSCVVVDQMCRCNGLGGTPLGGGTTCPVPTEACCGSDPTGIGDSGSCEDLTVSACTAAGGVSAGAGTDCSLMGTENVCSAFRACCGVTNISCGFFNLYMCVTDGGICQEPGSTCVFNADGDAFEDACDNCPFDANDNQYNSDTDEVGDVCDNCPLNGNASQADADADGVGDTCDNCVNTPNGLGGFCVAGRSPASCNFDADCDSTIGSNDGICAALSGTCTAGDATVVDCTSNADCNTCPDLDNGICSTNQENCGGAAAGDACDGDIDGDGVDNADDLCDFTPPNTNVEKGINNPFRGTLRADMDGDCDVDLDDHEIVFFSFTSGPACSASGHNVEDPLCGATIICPVDPPPGGGGGGCKGDCQTDFQQPLDNFTE